MTEVLIETATSKEVKQWESPPGRVVIPNTNDVVFPGRDTRPMAIGPNHFLVEATVVEPAVGENQKRGSETVEVDGKTVTITRPVVDLSDEEKASVVIGEAKTELRGSNERVAHVLTELVTKLLAKGTIATSDFTSSTKKMYDEMKTASDKLS